MAEPILHMDCYEYAQHPHGTYVTYRITGWVPNDTIAKKQQRHFFHLVVYGDTDETWAVSIDNHTFRLFWSPLASLPKMNPVQQTWVDWVNARKI